MNLISMLLAAFFAFTVGFVVGFLWGGRPKSNSAVVINPELEILRKLDTEYRNFLEYDGTVQA